MSNINDRDRDEILKKAILNGDLEEVKSISSKMRNVGKDLIIWSVRNPEKTKQRHKIIEALVPLAYYNEKDWVEERVLYWAAHYNDIKTTKLMLEKFGNFMPKKKSSISKAVRQCIIHENVEILKFYFEYFKFGDGKIKNPRKQMYTLFNPIAYTGYKNRNALSLAVAVKNNEIFDLLWPAFKNQNHEEAMVEACSKKNEYAFDKLMSVQDKLPASILFRLFSESLKSGGDWFVDKVLLKSTKEELSNIDFIPPPFVGAIENNDTTTAKKLLHKSTDEVIYMGLYEAINQDNDVIRDEIINKLNKLDGDMEEILRSSCSNQSINLLSYTVNQNKIKSFEKILPFYKDNEKEVGNALMWSECLEFDNDRYIFWQKMVDMCGLDEINWAIGNVLNYSDDDRPDYINFLFDYCDKEKMVERIRDLNHNNKEPMPNNHKTFLARYKIYQDKISIQKQVGSTKSNSKSKPKSQPRKF